MKGMIALAGVLALAAVPLVAQRPGQNSTIIHNVPYDGQFTYARIKYEAMGGGGGGGRGGGRFGGFRGSRIMWNHDFQTSDLHLPKILGALTTINVRTDESNVFTFDDPELFRFPLAYLCEAGYWNPTEAEMLGARKWLQKGGFLIIDDFGGYDWDNFTTQLQRILPGARPIRLDLTHSIFNSFFRDQVTRGARELPWCRGILRGVRGQRPHEADDDDCQLQLRRLGVLGVVGNGHLCRRAHQRGLQVRRQLRHVHPVPLTERIPRDRQPIAHPTGPPR